MYVIKRIFRRAYQTDSILSYTWTRHKKAHCLVHYVHVHIATQYVNYNLIRDLREAIFSDHEIGIIIDYIIQYWHSALQIVNYLLHLLKLESRYKGNHLHIRKSKNNQFLRGSFLKPFRPSLLWYYIYIYI